jgi:hypothetical protein
VFFYIFSIYCSSVLYLNRFVALNRMNLDLYSVLNSATKSDLNVTILISYDDIIRMDWWESHDAILNGKMKWLS